jgi:hypothetical protein
MLPLTATPGIDVVHVFTAELRYEAGMDAVLSLEERGRLVGSGTGRIDGPGIHGALRWSNFEQVLDDHCRLAVVGDIQTDDRAHVTFDSQGFALSGAERGGTWQVGAAVRFTTDDHRYAWLVAAPTVWLGEFDERTATARYRAYRGSCPTAAQ